MKTESHSIDEVLAKNATSFFIPPFQRAYAWGKTEIERYFFDMSRIINSEIDKESHDKLEHFFGTIVVKEEKVGFANRSIVVDGQQRLTTTLIFLIALRDLESDETSRDLITQTYLTNNASTFQDKIKLKQVTSDWEAFRALVNKTEAKQGIVNNAYLIFSQLIKENKRIKPYIKLEHYLTALHRMNVAVIFLDERPFKGEDPQIIFETLNSLGKPLSLSDLVRNFVLLNMSSEEQSSIYETIWHPRIESVLDDNSSKFFRDYLQYKTASSIKVVSDNNTKEVYQLFKSFVNECFDGHKTFISDIVRFVDWYKWIISEVVTDRISSDPINDRKIKELIRNIFHDIKSEAFKPFVLGLLEYHQDKAKTVNLGDDMLISILKTIRTYLIRRRILGLGQGENKNMVLFSTRIEELANSNVSMFDLLSNMFYSLRLPNDIEMKNELLILNFYEELKQYSKFILGKIEEYKAKVSVDFRNPKITIEHIMPQKLNTLWESELGENFAEIHKKYLHNIGNLILTEFNSEMGAKSFAEKKEKLSTSSLNFRLDIVKNEVWNEESIREHQFNMISWLLETFPLPGVFRETDNWNTNLIDSKIFSPLDSDAGDIAEGKKPVDIIIDNTKIKTPTWQDVFIKFLRYYKEKPDFDFEFIIENQFELFRRENTISKWTNLKDLVENNSDLRNRYKTFDSKMWSDVKNLTDDTIFIHVNISATACLARIANVMNKFNISASTVGIVLK